MKKIVFYSLISVVLLSCNSNKATKKVTNNNFREESIKRGKVLYKDLCAVCHLDSGKGISKIFPPLANSDYLMKGRKKSIIAIKKGLKGEIIVNNVKYNGSMSDLGLNITDVADVMNYITNSWGNKNLETITVKEVETILKSNK